MYSGAKVLRIFGLILAYEGSVTLGITLRGHLGFRVLGFGFRVSGLGFRV